MGLVTHTIVRSCIKAAGVAGIQVNQYVTGDLELNFSISIPAQTGSPITGANFQIHWSCTRAKLKHFHVQASRPGTLYTNAPSTGSPQDTIPLTTVTDTAGSETGEPQGWILDGDGIARCPFLGDVTTMYFTPPVGGPATLLQILAISDN